MSRIPEKNLEPLEDDIPITYCPTCGEALYEGDIFYPDFEVCEYCLDNHKKRVRGDN